jgi:hypothetical protein
MRGFTIVVCFLHAVSSISQAAAQSTQAAIEEVRLGFPALAPAEDGRDRLAKAGFWLPVYVHLQTGFRGTVHAESVDSDDVPNIYPAAPGSFSINEPQTLLGYTKPGSMRFDVQVTLRADNDEVRLRKTTDAMPVDESLCLCLGSGLAGLNQARHSDNPAHRTADYRVAHVPHVALAPDRWYGYDAVDLAILTTADRQFVAELLQDDVRKQALGDWVRRGGRLLISCGRNRRLLAELCRGLGLPLPVEEAGPMPASALQPLRTWTIGHQPFPETAALWENGVKLVRRPGAPCEMLLPAREQEQAPPLVMRWPGGMGQVTLVAFDLDQAPFVSWPGQADFWRTLLPKAGIRATAPATATGHRPAPDSGATDLATVLQHNLEKFPHVQTVPFGWTALLIAAFIVVVGPLDYLLMNRWRKRLRLGWVTFPAVVTLVTAAACFGAYRLKGQELCVNKVDLMDVDLAAGRCYGTTWFSVFSPRTQLYDITIEPIMEGATSAAIENGPVVSWFGRPEAGFGGFNRPRTQIVSGRAYEYDVNASGLKGVPIPIWSSKSFTGRWESVFSSQQRPSRLRRRPQTSGLDGIVVNPLTVTLHDAALIHGDTESQVRVYQLGTLMPGQGKPLAAVPEMQFSQWLPSTGKESATIPNALMRRIMFHDATANLDGMRNHALRFLDQSWRRALRETAMLVARAAPGKSTAAAGLKLRLTGGEATDHATPGIGAQETHYRILVPVAPALAAREKE